jgi:O-antigen/teichoic acid export membrane protein
MALASVNFPEEGGHPAFRRLVRAAAGTMGLRVANTALAFLATILLTRTIGASGFGAYAYAFAWMQVLSLFATLGTEKVLVRQFAAYHAQADWSRLLGLWKWARNLNVSLALLIAAVAAGIAAIGSGEDLALTFLVMLIGLPFLTVSKARQAALQGLHQVVAGQLADMFVRPSVFLLLLILAVWLAPDMLAAPTAMAFQNVAVLAAFLLGSWQLARHFPSAARTASATFESAAWLRSSIPLLMVAAITLLNTKLATLLLGTMAAADQVGLFAVAEKGAELIAFILFAVNASLAPAAARLHAQGNRPELQRLVFRSTRLVIVASLLIAGILLLFSRPFLTLFGPEFVQAEAALRILALGQIVNAAMGPVNLLLIMTGHERDAARGVAAGLAINVILAIVLIPMAGIVGAAIAVTVSMITWNLIAARYVHRRLGIYPTVLLSSRVK